MYPATIGQSLLSN